MKKILSFFKRKKIININIQSLGTFHIHNEKDTQCIKEKIMKIINDIDLG